MKIINLTSDHFQSVAEIYREGIATGNATFQRDAPAWDQWDKAHLQHSRIVAIDDDEVVGWAALSPVSSRSVYAGVAEVSIYIKSTHRGKGVGKKLLQHLITDSERNNIWTLQAGVFPENVASLNLHEQLGFRKIGYRERIGQMNGKWRDTVQLERRSSVVGI